MWRADALRQQQWDEHCARRPICGDCGRPILEDRALIVDEEMICEKCVENRKVWIDQ